MIRKPAARPRTRKSAHSRASARKSSAVVGGVRSSESGCVELRRANGRLSAARTLGATSVTKAMVYICSAVTLYSTLSMSYVCALGGRRDMWGVSSARALGGKKDMTGRRRTFKGGSWISSKEENVARGCAGEELRTGKMRGEECWLFLEVISTEVVFMATIRPKRLGCLRLVSFFSG